MRRLLLAALFCLSAAAQSFYLKDGDTVVFYGDSITDQRLYTTFTETYVLTRFPKLKVNFIHSGWGGDRVNGGAGGPIDVRLPRDVYTYKPNVVTIMLGMNDGRYRAFDQETFDAFAGGYKHIVQSAKAALPGVRITLIQPSPYDDVTRDPLFPGGYNAVLMRYSQFLKELAESEHLDLADLNTSVAAALDKAKSLDPDAAKLIVPDRIHPVAGGHILMAEALLKAWNAPPLVTSVEIDAAEKRVRRAQNTEIAALTSGPGLSWTQADSALPMPVDARDRVVALALRASDFTGALNQQPLRVTGLTGARYQLKIDDAAIGSFTREELEAGVNLATLATPMTKQAADVHALTLKHNNIHFTRWRQLQTGLEKDGPAHLKQAMDALDTLEADLIVAQRAAAQPKPHRYDLVPE